MVYKNANDILFELNGQKITAKPDETIWQAGKRAGIEIPHLCYKDSVDYRPDGNCRVCCVEIEGERVLAASCIRKPTDKMKVHSHNQRARKAQKMVLELLLADQPEKNNAHDKNSDFWKWCQKIDVNHSRFDKKPEKHNTNGIKAVKANPLVADNSHSSISVQLDACIHCNLCIRACREIQVNDVIGMAGRGDTQKIVFDFDDPMGDSTCVACGECVQACPTGALMPANLVEKNGTGAREADQKIDSVCPYCGVGCQITYNIKNEKIAWVDGKNGPANRNRLCVKGRFGFGYINHPQRLTKPLIRKKNMPKNMDVDPSNPYTHFRECEWDEAIELAGKGFLDAKNKFGANALAGFGSAKCSNEEAYLFQKLIRTGFGTNNVDHCTRLCHASSVAALLETIGSGAVTAPFTAAMDSEVIIVIGANPTENHPVAATYFKQAAKKGARLYVIDPRKNDLSKYATEMLAFTPGKDVALLNAFMNVIVNEKLYNPKYIDQFTEGFEILKQHLEQFTPEKMAPICGINENIIKMVARDYANAKTAIIFWGMGISQHIHGTDNARCLISLALMTGQIGKKGSGLHPLRGQNNVQGASDAGLVPMFYPDYKSVTDQDIRQEFQNLWQNNNLSPDKGLTVVEIINAISENKIKSMYIMGENPAMSDPDLNHVRKAIAKLDHLVVQDLFLTETAMFADIILPASAWPEKNGTVTNSNRQVQMGRKALETPGKAREDWKIILDIANSIGLEWNYQSVEEIFNEMKQTMPSLDNITWERLQNENAITYPCKKIDQPGEDILFAQGFPTKNKKGKFVPASIIQPDELPDDEFPMILTTGRQLEHWHTGTMTRRSKFLDDIEPQATVSVSPKDMDDMAIKPGQKITVETRRGNVTLAAKIDQNLKTGMIFIPFAYVEAAANLLTNPKLDPYGKIPEFKFCAARLKI